MVRVAQLGERCTLVRRSWVRLPPLATMKPSSWLLNEDGSFQLHRLNEFKLWFYTTFNENTWLFVSGGSHVCILDPDTGQVLLEMPTPQFYDHFRWLQIDAMFATKNPDGFLVGKKKNGTYFVACITKEGEIEIDDATPYTRLTPETTGHIISINFFNVRDAFDHGVCFIGNGNIRIKTRARKILNNFFK